MKHVTRFFVLLCIGIYLDEGHSEQIGGISPEKWNSKCKRHFDTHGNAATNIPIYMSGFCERYFCQKYGKDTYGIIADECATISTKNSKCRLFQTDPKAQFPECCLKIECDHTKGR